MYRSQIEFPDGVPDAIAAIRRSVCITRVRRLSHQDTNCFGTHGRGCKAQQGLTSLTFANVSGSECLPCSFVLLIHWICIPRPVLHLIDASVRLGPVDPYRVH